MPYILGIMRLNCRKPSNHVMYVGKKELVTLRLAGSARKTVASSVLLMNTSQDAVSVKHARHHHTKLYIDRLHPGCVMIDYT